MTHTQRPASAPHAPAEAWEYNVQRIEYDTSHVEVDVLNQMGADGWELVSAIPFSRGGTFRYVGGMTTQVEMIFKRRVHRGP